MQTEAGESVNVSRGIRPGKELAGFCALGIRTAKTNANVNQRKVATSRARALRRRDCIVFAGGYHSESFAKTLQDAKPRSALSWIELR